MRCPRCDQENPARAKFCLECGQRLPFACPSCQAPLPETAKFCLECGRPVAAAGAAAGPAPGASAGAPTAASVPAGGRADAGRAPAAYTPRHLAEKILTSRAALEGERKPVTVLFCDLVGSTSLAERLGPEGMHVLVNGFFDTALAEVHRYEGTVNQFLGDGFMALFGAPLAHEDHARRAALAALGIARILRERPVTVAPGVAVPLSVRMGLHTGFVVVGAIGDNLRMDYTAVGDTTHLAARLQQLARPDEILVSEATHRLTKGYVRAERVGPVSVRGRQEPVVVHRLLGTGPRRARLDGVEARGLSRFVGRDRDLRTLLDLVAAVQDGRGHAVGIVGEPGVGKSRLLVELRRALADRRIAYLQGRCVSYGATMPYVPIADLVRAHCGIRETDAPEVVADRVRLGLREVGLPPDEGAPYLLAVLGVSGGEARNDALGPEAVKARTFQTLRQLCVRASAERPLVLEVEDLHWIDRTSEEYLAFLVDALAGAAILLLATYRPGYRPPWADRSFATQLALGRLAREDSLSVVRSVLPAAGLADPLARLILDKAEGNPFFLEELARAVGEQGVGAGLPVPDTVHGVLTARIDRLPEEDKRLLQTAAVLGREFSPRLLAEIWDGAAVEPRLRALTHLEFLVERPAGPEPVYVFKHALTQDVAEGTLLPSRRRELHRRAAEALERLHPERRAELAAVLAHHYGQAEAWAPAAEHAGRAAEAARAAFANREALALYGQALGAAERAGWPTAALLRLREGRAEVHGTLGDFDQARADHEVALALARAAADPLAEARILGTLGALWGGHMDYDRGLALSREAVAAAERAGEGREARRAEAEARLRVGLMELNLARMTASRQTFERALELFRAAGDGGGEGRTLDALAMTLMLMGDLDTALGHAEAARTRLAEAGDRQTEASCLANLAFALIYRGRRADAAPLLRAAMDLAVRIGARAQQAYIHIATAELIEPYGDWDAAWAAAAAGLAIARDLGHREWTAAGLGAQGRLRRHAGDVTGARGAHEEMLGIARDLRTSLWTADALGELGQDLLAAGARDEARRLLEQAVQHAGEAAKFAMRPLLALGELALREHRPADALGHAREILARLGQCVVFAADAHRLEAEALAALGQTTAAERLLEQAEADAAALQATPPRWRAALSRARLLDAAGQTAEAARRRAAGEALRARAVGALAAVPELRSMASPAGNPSPADG